MIPARQQNEYIDEIAKGIINPIREPISNIQVITHSNKRAIRHQNRKTPILNTQDTPYVELQQGNQTVIASQPPSTLFEKVSRPVSSLFGYKTPVKLYTQPITPVKPTTYVHEISQPSSSRYDQPMTSSSPTSLFERVSRPVTSLFGYKTPVKPLTQPITPNKPTTYVREDKGKEVSHASSSVDQPMIISPSSSIFESAQSTPVLSPTYNLFSDPNIIDRNELMNSRNKKESQMQTEYISPSNPYYMFLEKDKDQRFLKPITKTELNDLHLQSITQRKPTRILSANRYDRKKKFIFKS